MYKINILIFFILFFQTYSIIPKWDFNAQSIDLSPSQESNYNYTTYSKDNIRLEKIFTRNNGKITYKNQLTIGNVTIEVPFDYIGSYYYNLLGCDILICPKGKFRPYIFTNNQSIIPSYFEESGDWELKCYKHEAGHFLIFYLMNDGQKNFYNVNYEYMYGMYGIRYKSFYNNLYDLKLGYEINGDNRYIFPTIVKDGEYIKLVGNSLTIYSTQSDLHFSSLLSAHLIQAKLKTQAYIEDRCYFYFFTYDDINSFSSG